MILKISLPEEVLDAMKKIIDYGIADEEKHYEESVQETKSDILHQQLTAGESMGINIDMTPELTNHIYNSFELVNRFLHSQDLNAEIYNQQHGVIS